MCRAIPVSLVLTFASLTAGCDQQDAPSTLNPYIENSRLNDRNYRNTLINQAKLVSLAIECLVDDETAEYGDLRKILTQARSARDSEDYKTALGKHICVHIFGVGTPFIGVRGSFALSDWQELGSKYPPATEALRIFRDEAENAVRAKKDYFWNAFRDFTAINGKLSESEKNVDLFLWIHENDATMANRVFDIVSDYLIEDGKYDLWVSYVPNPAAKFNEILQSYTLEINNPRPAKMADMLIEAAEHRFMWETTKLVGALAANGLKDEAQEVIATALAVRTDDQFREQLERALAGEITEPKFLY